MLSQAVNSDLATCSTSGLYAAPNITKFVTASFTKTVSSDGENPSLSSDTATNDCAHGGRYLKLVNVCSDECG